MYRKSILFLKLQVSFCKDSGCTEPVHCFLWSIRFLEKFQFILSYSLWNSPWIIFTYCWIRTFKRFFPVSLWTTLTVFREWQRRILQWSLYVGRSEQQVFAFLVWFGIHFSWNSKSSYRTWPINPEFYFYTLGRFSSNV